MNSPIFFFDWQALTVFILGIIAVTFAIIDIIAFIWMKHYVKKCAKEAKELYTKKDFAYKMVPCIITEYYRYREILVTFRYRNRLIRYYTFVTNNDKYKNVDYFKVAEERIMAMVNNGDIVIYARMYARYGYFRFYKFEYKKSKYVLEKK